MKEEEKVNELVQGLENLEKSVKSILEVANLAKNEAQGDSVINEMYNKMLKIQDSIGKESSPVKRIQYTQQLTDLINKI